MILEVYYDIMMRASFYKYIQHPELINMLLLTKNAKTYSYCW